MIKLFRKIRYDHMGKNKTSKYLKYAICKALLVAIGILIALQINTWNEHKKEKNQITKIFTEVKNNLVTDSIEIASVYKYLFTLCPI